MGERRFVVELIKPSHYDDDGYVIQWVRSWIPSNSLACLYAIAQDAAARRALGPDVAIEINAYDECHTVIPVKRIIRRIKAADGGLVCLVGVQSNQFPRAVDIARQFRAAGVQVAIGGFHVSGCISMLPELPPDIAAARDIGIALFAGEAEGRLDRVFADALAGDVAADLQFHERSAGLAGAGHAVSADRDRPALQRDPGRVRRRARLPVPVQLLHDHQRAGAQVALARRRRRRAAGARQPRAGGLSLLHHRRQFRPQPQLGGDLRPADRDAREGRADAALPDPGRYAVPPHPELYREGGARRLQPGLHRAGKHQPGQSAGGQEEAEPGARIPPAVPRLAQAQGHHLCRVYSRLPERHAGADLPRHQDRAATNCRSMCSNSSS